MTWPYSVHISFDGELNRNITFWLPSNKALELISGLQEAFNSQVDAVDWMDEATKVKARVKVSHVTRHSGISSLDV